MPDVEVSPVSVSAPGGVTPEQGIGLCLSGGGYRAMLFHVGVILRLGELGYLGTSHRTGKHGPLGRLQRVSSVSGGSIAAARLGLAWDNLNVDDPGLPDRLHEHLLEPIQAFASQTTISIVSGLFSAIFGSINGRVTKVYRKRLYGDATLQKLPESPRFVINATNLQSGALWRFSRQYTWDYRVGKRANPRDLIASAVGASSAFPPFLSPARFEYKESEYEPNTGQDLQFPRYTTRPVLSDGGVYDNMGLETVYKRYQTVLVSDAGGAYDSRMKVPTNWATQSYRVLNTIDNQVRSLRKRVLIANYDKQRRFGAYWSINGDISKYPAPKTLPCPLDRTQALAGIATDLAKKDRTTQRRLINWGYAICDAGIRGWVEDGLSHPEDFPFPQEKV